MGKCVETVPKENGQYGIMINGTEIGRPFRSHPVALDVLIWLTNNITELLKVLTNKEEDCEKGIDREGSRNT